LRLWSVKSKLWILVLNKRVRWFAASILWMSSKESEGTSKEAFPPFVPFSCGYCCYIWEDIGVEVWGPRRTGIVGYGNNPGLSVQGTLRTSQQYPTIANSETSYLPKGLDN
jgi:hypothetical protein